MPEYVTEEGGGVSSRQVGKGYVLSASLIGSADGRVLTAVRETAADDGRLLDAIDRLSKKLRERVGESLVSIRENPPLEQVTTGSLPALRKYSEALRLEENDKSEAAIPAAASRRTRYSAHGQ